MFTSTTTSDYSFLDCPPIRPIVMEKTATTTKWRYTNNEIAPNCPRCASSNTKFCYYNNYSLSQPRYFCKGCRRYWTKGGSLRNVPVGGGCRKSRRARAARQGVAVHCPGPTPSPGSVGSTEGGSGIDLAAVFAKYVNSNEENLSHSLSSSSSENVQTSSLDIDSQLDDTSAMFEYHQQPLDLISGGDDQIQQLISMHEDMNGQDFVYQDCNAFEPQDNILGDELAADVLWSSDGSNLSNFDLGLFSGDDQLRNPTNLVSDYWGAFDLSAYEIFSRP